MSECYIYQSLLMIQQSSKVALVCSLVSFPEQWAWYRTTGNFRWCNISRKYIQWNFRSFWLSCNMTLWPHPYQLMAMSHMWTEEMTLNNKVNKQACARMAYSPFCVEAFAITKVSGLPLRARNQPVELLISLDFENSGASLLGLLAFCKVAGWFFSTATI